MPANPTLNAWQGPRIRLRAFEARDWEAYHAWNADTEMARALYFIPPPQSPDAARRWAEEEATQPRDGDNMRFVITVADGDVVGDLTVNDCDRRVGTFAYGIGIRHDRRGKGYAAEAIGIVLRYYFDELRYQKATIQIADFNAASIRLHEKLGFQQEGRLRRHGFTHGTHHDMLVYGLLAEEWRERSDGR